MPDRYYALRAHADGDQPSAVRVTRQPTRYRRHRQSRQPLAPESLQRGNSQGEECGQRCKGIPRQPKHELTVVEACERLRMPR